jgi:Ribonuclease G/E
VTVSIRIASSPGQAQIAVVADNRLLDYTLWRPGSPDGVGDVHRARIVAQVPAMAGAFVALADAEGFLPDSDGAKGLAAGTVLAVRITRAAQGNKGPRLTARIDDQPGTGPLIRLRSGPNPVARLAARYPGAAIMVDDAALAASLRLSLSFHSSAPPDDHRTRASTDAANRIVLTHSALLFDDDIADAIEALSRPTVELPGGARLSIWPTPALVAIDVDAAAALAHSGTRSSAGAGARHEALNRAIVPAIADQIRLRNLSGGIVVDLAGLSVRKRAGLAPDFVAALANDPLHPKFLGFTALGLAEIVRTRIHPPLHELLAGPLAAGLAALRAATAAYHRDALGSPTIRTHPAVVSALQADAAALPDLARRIGRPVKLRSDPSLPETVWVLERDHA